jgi:ribonuclease J
MTITVHRPNQIGGCITEIESSSGTRIVIDVGSNLPGTESEEVYVKELTKGCGGVFVTHYHGDHIGLLDKALPEVPVYIGAVAKKILINLAGRIYRERLPLFEKIKPIVGNEEILVGDIKITPVPFADHSAIDAYMYVVEANGCRILHTGDFRLHGMQGDVTIKMLNRFAKNIDYIICEGTLLSRENAIPMSESELQRKAGEMMEANPYVFVLCSSTNIERMLSFYKESQRLGRFFVCDEYQKKQIEAASEALADLGENNFNMKYVYDYAPNLDKHMKKNGFCMLVRQGDYFKNIMEKYENCLVVYSMWTGYINERAKNQELVDFLTPYRYSVLHTSGHASKDDLKKLFDIVNPKRGLIPIHTDAPEKFREIFPEEKLFIKNDREHFCLNEDKILTEAKRRKTMYSKETIRNTIIGVAKSAPETLYNEHYVKTPDKTDCGVRVNEVVAEVLLANIDALSKIKMDTREYYKAQSHEELARIAKTEGKPKESNQHEQWLAKSLYHEEITGLGKILDFQVPIQSVRAGKVDLLSHDNEKNVAHLIELKIPDSQETLLRCVLEIYTYWCIANKEKLLHDFEISGAELRKGVLIYESSRPHLDFDECTMVRKLMNELKVDLFVLHEDNARIIPQ